jgi:TfoX/Sxy family transcriptional regulator of competence genes
MADQALSRETQFLQLVDSMRQETDVTYGVDTMSSTRAFGSTALKIHDKIFAMLVKDRFVVKLSRQRIDRLIEAEEGERLQMSAGRAMKEWFMVSPESDVDWQTLAQEALAFATSKA